jgi:hypothetical protein
MLQIVTPKPAKGSTLDARKTDPRKQTGRDGIRRR